MRFTCVLLGALAFVVGVDLTVFSPVPVIRERRFEPLIAALDGMPPGLFGYHPRATEMMEVMRSQLRALLDDGTAYALRHPEDWRAVRQLRRLAITLAADAKVAREVVGGARTSDEPAGDNIMAGRIDPGQRRDPP